MEDGFPEVPAPADSFGLPKWLEMACPICREQMGREHILDFGVVLTPAYRGDLAVSYLCRKCSCLAEVRYRSVIKGVADLSRILQSADPPCAPKLYEDVVREHHHGQNHCRK